MLDYEKFIEWVKQNAEEYEKWEHVLASVPDVHRERFISIINLGVNIPKAYDLILISKDLSEEEFNDKLSSLKK